MRTVKERIEEEKDIYVAVEYLFDEKEQSEPNFMLRYGAEGFVITDMTAGDVRAVIDCLQCALRRSGAEQ